MKVAGVPNIKDSWIFVGVSPFTTQQKRSKYTVYKTGIVIATLNVVVAPKPKPSMEFLQGNPMGFHKPLIISRPAISGGWAL